MGLVGGDGTCREVKSLSKKVQAVNSVLVSLQERQDAGPLRVEEETHHTIRACRYELYKLIETMDTYLAAPAVKYDPFSGKW